MSFVVDKQTLDDLNLLGKYKSSSVFHIFNNTVTEGGERMLENMFISPLDNLNEINKRSIVFKSFIEKPLQFPFDREQIESVEFYLSFPAGFTRGMNLLKIVSKKAMIYIAADENYNNLKKGLSDTIDLFKQLRLFCEKLKKEYPDANHVYDKVDKLIGNNKNIFYLELPPDYKDISFFTLANIHYKLHVELIDIVRELLNVIYSLDVYISVSNLAVERRFNCASICETKGEDNYINCKNLFHPSLRNAKANSVEIDSSNNVIFLTGANMAGKSTFMKSFGIAIYLAHMGFPVPAESMKLTLKDGLYTSINVPDNLSLGYSHFYAEVKRVKFVAEQVSRKLNLVIIFDELFKGTNVKDAYDATVEVVKSFSQHLNCNYIISTHIIEAGEALQKDCNNFKYLFFPTIMNGNIPKYTYQLAEGITSDRHGMMIIRNEKILDIING